jgi:Tfx family DNA-binding protein
LLTERQLTVMHLRSQGLTQSEVARKLKLTRQDVSALERSGIRNLESAFDAIDLACGKGVARRIRLVRGTHILDAGREILKQADASGIRLQRSIVDILQLLRIELQESIYGGMLREEREVLLLYNGHVRIAPLRE